MSASDLEAGMADLQAGRWAQGIERLRGVLAREPGFAEVWSNLAFALRATGRLDEAREALNRALALSPKLADAWNLLGLVEQETAGHAAALECFDRALALRPDFAAAHMNRANSEQALGRTEAALASYARALAIAPLNAGIHYNLGHLHQKVTGRMDAALACYREAIRLEPRFADAHLNAAHVLLMLGRLDEGWPEFAWRPQRRTFAAVRAAEGRPYELPAREPWPSRLHVRAEQGLGDILFFLRYAPLAAARGSALAFSGEPRLDPLLHRTGRFERVAEGPEILVADLPLLFPELQDPASIPSLGLAVDADARERMAQRLRAAGPPPWIALTWRAGERSRGLFDRLFKEAPLEALGAALRGVRATWISVQRAPGPGETERLAQAMGAPVHDFSDVNADLDAALAAMALVDDYIAVSNTNVHLRAEAGRAARVLVPFAPEWRWGLEGRSPWFPAMETYREAPGGGWAPALAQLTRDMRP